VFSPALLSTPALRRAEKAEFFMELLIFLELSKMRNTSLHCGGGT